MPNNKAFDGCKRDQLSSANDGLRATGLTIIWT